MATRPIYLDNVLRESWNDDTRIVTFYNASGAETSTRAYTAPEIAALTAAQTAAAEIANEATIAVALFNALATLQLIIDDTNANINANPAARIKDLAKVLRRVIRLVIRRFDGTT
jgi:hypothetical protein